MANIARKGVPAFIRTGGGSMLGPIDQMSPELLRIRLNQLLYDKRQTGTKGYDTSGADYAHYNNQITEIRKLLKGVK